VRPLEQFVAQWERVLQRVRSGGVRAVSVVGGGAAGVELAFAMDHRFRAEKGGAAPHVRILTDGRGLLPDFGRGVRARMRRLAQDRNIGAHGESPVAEVGADFLRLRNNMEFATDATFWVAGAAAPEFIRGSGFRTDKGGFLTVNAFMQSDTRPEIFGVGDCATNPRDPRPKAGVFAVRAGPALMTNLMAAVHGGPLKHHATSRRFLALISCGGQYAVLAWWPFSLEGEWAWRWKDRIDRQFIAGYGAQALAASPA
jgi:selenide,water dikinase